VAVRPEDRPVNIRSLQQAQAGHGSEGLERLLYERLDETLSEYLPERQGALPAQKPAWIDGKNEKMVEISMLYRR
jgi:hypothetical protein